MDRITKNILLILSKPYLRQSRFMEVYERNSCNIEKTISYFNKNYKFEIQHFKLQENELLNSAIQVNTLLKYLSKEKIGLINISQNCYPELLKQIHMPPPLIFYKGEKIKECGLNMAVVGTRKYTSYGKDAAIYIAGRLSEIGITIVSGMAAGIDYWAQKEAVKYKGGSIGVLGCGINIMYPPENKDLFEEIINNGSIITEFFPDTPPYKNNFPARNRVISGLCAGVIVIEAGEKSGALITSNFALSQNREVFAVPGSIFNYESKGCNRLIKNGAKLVQDVDDILEEISQFQNYFKLNKTGISPGNKNNKIISSLLDKKDNMGITRKKLKPEEKTIFDLLGYIPKSLEEIIRVTGFGVNRTLQAITELELKNLIKEKNLNEFVRM